MFAIPKLQIPNPLPRPRVQPPICNRNSNTRANQRTLNMRRHIITALSIMPIQPLPLLVLRHNAVQRRAHVGAYIGVVVFVQRERARCVLDKEVEQACFVGLYFGDGLEDLVGYKVGAAGPAGERDRFLCPVGLLAIILAHPL
jgi:hypothetical protein